MKDSRSGKSYVELDVVADNYEDAIRRCSAIGGMLPEPRNAQENAFLEHMGTLYWFFLGATDSFQEGHWGWNSDYTLVTWTSWMVGEPDMGTEQNCASMARNYPVGNTTKTVWGSSWCVHPNHTKTPVVCEKIRKYTFITR